MAWGDVVGPTTNYTDIGGNFLVTAAGDYLVTAAGAYLVKGVYENIYTDITGPTTIWSNV